MIRPMKSTLLAACAALALGAALTTSGSVFAQAPAAAPTAAEAQAFVAKAEADLDAADLFASKAAWIANTYINIDSQFIEAKASGEQAALASRLGAEAARFNAVEVDPVTRRKLNILKQGITLPAPPRPGAAAELAGIVSKMRGTYGAATFQANGKTYNLDEAEATLRTSRNPAEIKAVWEGWHSISPPMAADYAKFVALSNEGAKALGYADTGALWRSNYDMAPDAFAAETDRVWAQLEPFYKNLHCYVRARLNAKYGDAVQPKTGPIRADLLGNMWAQEWGNIYDIVAPPASKPAYDLTGLLVAKGYDPIRMVKTGEGFYSSLGYAPLPETFWQRSQIVRPRDRDVICHASAWDVDAKDDLRIKMCTTVTADDFITVHHELGHNYYQRAYNKQSNLFRGAANDGFHEAIGDFAALSAVTPTYLQQIGLLDGELPGADSDIPYLLRQAMDKIAFLPFGLLIDKWRWQVFSGAVQPADYNAAWWALRTQYQGIAPPAARPADAFDPGAKFHIPNNTPYTRYFLARVYQFQFYRAACKQAGWKGPLHRCSVYGDKTVGAKFNAMMEMGASRPWPEAMAAFTGETRTEASAVADYFAPLNVWLTQQNKGQQCGWTAPLRS
jgi:peptidyl-dipeptidase A